MTAILIMRMEGRKIFPASLVPTYMSTWTTIMAFPYIFFCLLAVAYGDCFFLQIPRSSYISWSHELIVDTPSPKIRARSSNPLQDMPRLLQRLPNFVLIHDVIIFFRALSHIETHNIWLHAAAPLCTWAVTTSCEYWLRSLELTKPPTSESKTL